MNAFIEARAEALNTTTTLLSVANVEHKPFGVVATVGDVHGINDGHALVAWFDSALNGNSANLRAWEWIHKMESDRAFAKRWMRVELESCAGR